MLLYMHKYLTLLEKDKYITMKTSNQKHEQFEKHEFRVTGFC